MMRSWILTFGFLSCSIMGLLPLLLHAADAEKITVTIVSRTVFYLPVWLAARRGYFRDEDLDVRVEVFDNAERINAALRDGTVQVAMSTPESIIVDSLHGGTLRVVAGNAGRLPHFVITRPEIRTLADLRGKTIGVLSDQEGTTHLVLEIARGAGLTPSDYNSEGGRRGAHALAAAAIRADRRRAAAVPAEL